MIDDREALIEEARALAQMTLDAARDEIDSRFNGLLEQVRQRRPTPRRRRLLPLKLACGELGKSPKTVKRYAVEFGAGWRDETGRWSIDVDCIASRLKHFRR